MTIRLDPADLTIETDDKGFIIGESLLGDKITDEANAWREVKNDFSHLSLTLNVSVEKGVLFRPEAAQLTLRTPTLNYMSSVFGRRIRVKWKGELLFVGEIKSAKLSARAGAETPDQFMNITAMGTVQKAVTYVQYEYSAPAQTTGQRLVQASAGSGVNVQAIDCDRMMPDRPQSNVKLMTVLQEAADVQLARFYSNRANVLVLDSRAASTPVMTFSDDAEQANRVKYEGVEMDNNLDNVITGVVVTAKQFESRYGMRRLTSNQVYREETYEVDLPDVQADVNAWTASFPLLGYAHMEPSSISTYWQDRLIDLELTQLVTVVWNGKTYQCGVKGIRMDIRPDAERGLVWGVGIDLMPGHLVNRVNYNAPSPPQTFETTAITTNSVSFAWTRPAAVGSMNGYMIRYKEGVGAVAPVSTTDGTLLGVYDTSTLTAVHANAGSFKYYKYSLFATTSSPLVSSQPVTLSAITDAVTPSAMQSLAITKSHVAYPTQNYAELQSMRHSLTWAAPATGDVGKYVFAWKFDGSTPTQTNNDGTRDVVRTALGTFIGLPFDSTGRNKNVRYAAWAVSPTGVYGPPVYSTADSNETMPGSTTITLTKVSTGRINFRFTKAAGDLKDMWKYRVMYSVNAGGPPLDPNAGTFLNEWSYTTAETENYNRDISGLPNNSWIDVSVFVMTWGGLWTRYSAFINTGT